MAIYSIRRFSQWGGVEERLYRNKENREYFRNLERQKAIAREEELARQMAAEGNPNAVVHQNQANAVRQVNENGIHNRYTKNADAVDQARRDARFNERNFLKENGVTKGNPAYNTALEQVNQAYEPRIRSAKEVDLRVERQNKYAVQDQRAHQNAGHRDRLSERKGWTTTERMKTNGYGSYIGGQYNAEFAHESATEGERLRQHLEKRKLEMRKDLGDKANKIAHTEASADPGRMMGTQGVKSNQEAVNEFLKNRKGNENFNQYTERLRQEKEAAEQQARAAQEAKIAQEKKIAEQQAAEEARRKAAEAEAKRVAEQKAEEAAKKAAQQTTTTPPPVETPKPQTPPKPQGEIPKPPTTTPQPEPPVNTNTGKGNGKPKFKLGRAAKIGLGVAGGAAILGGGYYLWNKNRNQNNGNVQNTTTLQ